ncbi:MAG: hypothetical protein ACOC2C_01775, partial [Cyclonatronaceae bacterium]
MVHHIYAIWLAILLCISVQSADLRAQQTQMGQAPVRFIPPAEYNEHAQNWDVTQAYDGMMYFANMHGLMIYDGYSWELKPLPSSVLSLHFSDDEQLYAGLTADFGILHQQPDGSLRYESLFERMRQAGREVPPHDFIDTFQMTEIGGIIYMSTDAGLYAWDGQKISYWEDVIPFFITDHQDLLLIRRNDGSLFMPAAPDIPVEIVDAAGEPAPLEQRINGLFQHPDGSYRVITQDGYIYELIPLYEDSAGQGRAEQTAVPSRYHLHADSGKPLEYLSDAFVYDVHAAGGHYYISTFNNGLFSIKPDGNLHRHYNTSNGLKDNFILNIHRDSFGALWLTGMYGITVIYEDSGISVLNGYNGIESNIWAAGFRENDFYIGSSNGLLHARLDARRPLKFSPIAEVGDDGIFSSFESLQLSEDGPARMFAYSELGLYELRGTTAEFIDHRVGERLFTSSLFPGLIFTDEFLGHLRALRENEDGSWWIGNDPDFVED